MNDQDKVALDRARLEYAELGAYVRTATTVIWDAFKTYFTVAALIFAGWGFASGSDKLRGDARTYVLMALSLAGVAVTTLAAIAIARVRQYLDTLLKYATGLETKLPAIGTLVEGKLAAVDDKISANQSLYGALKKVWNEARIPLIGTAPAMTYIVLTVFALAWLATLFLAVR